MWVLLAAANIHDAKLKKVQLLSVCALTSFSPTVADFVPAKDSGSTREHANLLNKSRVT
jgi:hypothetical protein